MLIGWRRYWHHALDDKPRRYLKYLGIRLGHGEIDELKNLGAEPRIFARYLQIHLQGGRGPEVMGGDESLIAPGCGGGDLKSLTRAVDVHAIHYVVTQIYAGKKTQAVVRQSVGVQREFGFC